MHAMHLLEQDDQTSQEHHHALVPSSMGREIIGLQARPMDPSKDLAAYGYGSVAWKERMDRWKQRQGKLRDMSKEDGNEDQDNVPDDDDTEFPLYVFLLNFFSIYMKIYIERVLYYEIVR